MNSIKRAWTKSEMQAYLLLNQNNVMSTSTTTGNDEIAKAADTIISLAERIKNERIAQIRDIGLNS